MVDMQVVLWGLALPEEELLSFTCSCPTATEHMPHQSMQLTQMTRLLAALQAQARFWSSHSICIWQPAEA